jgi:hypothetical protein
MEVPYSWTWPHFVVDSDSGSSTGSFGELSYGLGRDKYRDLHAQVKNTIYGVLWTHDSAGFVFGVHAYDPKRKASTYDGYLASVDGKITTLAHVGPDALKRAISVGVLSRDRKYLVSTDLQMAHPEYRPLIWDVKNNKPRATCFLYLKPSATSGRWIGIEKDTRQLVVVDEQFEVIKRFDQTTSNKSFGFKLEWSPDERFIIWRNQVGFDHFSNWEGFWMDLDTGEKRELSGRFMNERFGFTGRGGEFWRCGVTGAKTSHYDAVIGAHLTIVPWGKGEPRDVWRIKTDPNTRAFGDHAMFPPLRTDSTGELFALGLPRPQQKPPGWVWHLIDRQGKTWPFPGEDNGEFISPFDVAGFAEGDQTIIAYDETRLFALPVASIKDWAAKR